MTPHILAFVGLLGFVPRREPPDEPPDDEDQMDGRLPQRMIDDEPPPPDEPRDPEPNDPGASGIECSLPDVTRVIEDDDPR